MRLCCKNDDGIPVDGARLKPLWQNVQEAVTRIYTHPHRCTSMENCLEQKDDLEPHESFNMHTEPVPKAWRQAAPDPFHSSTGRSHRSLP